MGFSLRASNGNPFLYTARLDHLFCCLSLFILTTIYSFILVYVLSLQSWCGYFLSSTDVAIIDLIVALKADFKTELILAFKKGQAFFTLKFRLEMRRNKLLFLIVFFIFPVFYTVFYIYLMYNHISRFGYNLNTCAFIQDGWIFCKP